jgi:predicted O-methyltransferase YrrM
MIEPILQLHAQQRVTDRELLGELLHPDDVDSDYLAGDQTYAWYHAVAQHLRPGRIGEIGVRLGYSLWSMARGAGSSAVALRGWDAERYVGESNGYCLPRLRARFPDTQLAHTDTAAVSRLSEGELDLFHVDGDHSEAGARHDLGLAWAATRSGGTILVDDYSFIAGVRSAVNGFCHERRLAYHYLPTFRGLALITKRG